LAICADAPLDILSIQALEDNPIMARLIYLIEPPDGHARQNSTSGIEFHLTIGWQPFFISPNRRPDNLLILPRERIVLPYKQLWSGRGCYRRWANSPSMTFAGLNRTLSRIVEGPCGIRGWLPVPIRPHLQFLARGVLHWCRPQIHYSSNA
jgi:hypothetical protein